jgi:hypothetical protein
MTRRITVARLEALEQALGERERQIVRLVAALRLISHSQLAAVLQADADWQASPASQARSIRRTLARLTADGLLERLDRRVGGLRAGSNGYIYYLGPVGQRLMAYWNGDGLVRGRRRPDPSARYVDHRLAITGLYVDLIGAERMGVVELLSFDVEPDCWRHHVDRFGASSILKPDALARLGIGLFQDDWFIEVDLGTESSTVIARKAQAYWDYFQTGVEQEQHGVFPRVVFITNSEVRRQRIVDACLRLPAEAWELFAVTTLDKAIDLLSGRLPDRGRGRMES